MLSRPMEHSYSFSMRIDVGILGATGMVGQRYISLLAKHPWYRVAFVAASPASAGKRYGDAVTGRWRMHDTLSPEVANLVIADAADVGAARGRCSLVFSCLEMGKDEVAALELAWAAAGHPVVSNSSAHRWTEDVPMIIPEINHAHASLIETQRRNRGFGSGLVAVKPNCSLQSWITPVEALREAGFPVNRIMVTTFQAASGAGFPGVPSLDLIDNIIPLIGGEEEKTEREPLRILGRLQGEGITLEPNLVISASCNRVPVTDGHGAAVSLGFSGPKPSMEEVKRIFQGFRALPQEMGLPSAPAQPIVVREEIDRPQPARDRDAGGGMAVSVGRIRECPLLDLRFFGMSHNTIRGAAGGGILTAELLTKLGYIAESGATWTAELSLPASAIASMARARELVGCS